MGIDPNLDEEIKKLTLFTSLVRRLCSVKFFEFHVAFFDQGHYLATKLRCFDLQSLAVGEEWVFNALRVQFLKVFHWIQKDREKNVKKDFYLIYYSLWRLISSILFSISSWIST